MPAPSTTRLLSHIDFDILGFKAT